MFLFVQNPLDSIDLKDNVVDLFQVCNFRIELLFNQAGTLGLKLVISFDKAIGLV
jgi:hypothetical protein